MAPTEDRSSSTTGSGIPSRIRGALLAPFLALVVSLVAAAPVSGQDQEGLSFVLGVAYLNGGPGPALVDDLRAADLGDVRRGRCAAATCLDDDIFPFYFDEGLGLAGIFGLRYRFAGPWSAEALLSNGPRGHAEGYRADDKFHLVIGYASAILSGTMGLHVGPVRVGVGPVVNMTAWEITRNNGSNGNGSTGTLGATAGVSGNVRVQDVLLSIRTGFRGFPERSLTQNLGVPVAPDYRSFYVGVTATPLHE